MENVYVHGLFFVIYLVQDGRSTDLPGHNYRHRRRSSSGGHIDADEAPDAGDIPTISPPSYEDATYESYHYGGSGYGGDGGGGGD